MSPPKRKSNGEPGSSQKRQKTAQEQIADDRNAIAKLPVADLTNDAILDYVTKTEPPFIVRSQPLDKKHKKLVKKDIAHFESTLPKGRLLHKDSHSERLVITYGIHPTNVWEHLRRYKKFTLGDPDKGTHMSAGPGDYILVKHDESSEDAILDRERQWKAQVQEIRALDAEHVWVRVTWLNRPSDLEEDGKDISHYAKSELIPTNQLDIIDAMSVNGKITVDYWNESGTSNPPKDTYYWRHAYDAAITRQFARPLKKICICKKPIQPDKLSIGCEKCGLWQHGGCILKEFSKSKNDSKVPQLDFDDDKLKETATAYMADGKKGATYLFFDQKQQALVHVNGSDRRGGPVACLKCQSELKYEPQ